MNPQDKETVEEIKKTATAPKQGDMMSQVFNDLANGNCSNVYVLLGVIERLEIKCNNLELLLSAGVGLEVEVKAPTDEMFKAIRARGVYPGTIGVDKAAGKSASSVTIRKGEIFDSMTNTIDSPGDMAPGILE